MKKYQWRNNSLELQKEIKNYSINNFPEEFNIIPIIKNSKKPLIKWKKYQKERYPQQQLTTHDGNYAVICGEISRNLIIFDPDLKKKEDYKKILTTYGKKYPELIKTLLVETPHGYHHYHNSNNFIIKRQTFKNAGYEYNKNGEIKGFNGITKTKFSKYLKGFDILGENGYALLWGSKINGLEYKKRSDLPIKYLTKKEFEHIKNFFLLKKPISMRQPFIDICNGKIEVHDIAKQTGKKELIYWKFTFFEAYFYCGLYPKELFEGLKKFQPSFDQKEMVTQLKYEYHQPWGFWINDKGKKVTNKPLSSKKMKEYFPDYELSIEPSFLPQENELIQYEEDNELFTEKYGELFETLEFNNCQIELRETGIYKAVWKFPSDGAPYCIRTLVLDGKLEILKMTIDKQQNNTNLFVCFFGDKYFHTKSITEMLEILNEQIYMGNIGRDIIRRVFNVTTEKMQELAQKPEYILGFNDGWKLPQLENNKGFLLILYTDYQKDAYLRAKNMLSEYPENEKEIIRQNLKKILEITQVSPIKTIMIIAWATASPFRLPIIEYLEFFPHLLNYGRKYTGKSILEKLFIVHFYGILKQHLTPLTLDSTARLEDYLSQSTFPISLQEVYETKNFAVEPILKDHATGGGDYERKKNARELDFRKPKVAGVNLDCNEIPKGFLKPAFNSRCATIEYSTIDKIEFDPEWKKLYRDLRKEKLFSFLFEYTKDWNNETVFETLDGIYQYINNNKDEIMDIEKLESDYPRLVITYQILLFGIYLFENSFDIDFKSIIKSNKYWEKYKEIDIRKEILILLIKGRQVISREIKDKFYHFCKLAVSFDEGYNDDNGNYHRGNNPKFLTCKLEMEKNNFHFVFTQDNLRDFTEYTRERFSMKELAELVEDAIKDKDDIQYTRIRTKEGSRPWVILINKEWIQ